MDLSVDKAIDGIQRIDVWRTLARGCSYPSWHSRSGRFQRMIGRSLHSRLAVPGCGKRWSPWELPPFYDSGSSLGYDKLTPQIRSGLNIICKPFKRNHQDQLRLVTSFD